MNTKSIIILAKALIVVCMMFCSVKVSYAEVTIEMTKEDGVYTLPGKVNGLPLRFIFDTGASSVSLSLSEAIFMLKNGYLSEKDIVGASYSQIANGDIIENTEVILREVEVGGIVLHNVEAHISHTLSAPLLLGQSAIQKLGPIQLNGNKLIIQNGRDFKSDEKSYEYYSQAYQANEAGNYSEAIILAKKTIETANSNEYKSYGYEQIVRAYSGLEDMQNAIKYAHEGLTIDPNNVELGYNIGVYYYNINEYDRAKNLLDHFIRTHQNAPTRSPDFTKRCIAGAYNYLGKIQKEEGFLANAENSFKQSLNYNSDHQASYMDLGSLYYDQEKYNLAIDYLNKAISYIPSRPSAIDCYYRLGMSYYYLDNVNKAKENFSKCCSVYSDNFSKMENDSIFFSEKALKDEWFVNSCLIPHVSSNIWLARLSSTPTECIEKYRVVQQYGLQLFLTSDDYKLLARAFAATKNPLDCFMTLYEGYESFPSDIELAFMLSTQMQDGDKKVEVLKNILKYEYAQKPSSFDYGTVYNNIAWCYCCMKQYDDALPFALKGVKLNPEHGYSWETLGEVYYYLGRYQDCVDAMTKCITSTENKEPDLEKSALTFRGNAYTKLGKIKDGNKDLEKASKL